MSGQTGKCWVLRTRPIPESAIFPHASIPESGCDRYAALCESPSLAGLKTGVSNREIA